MNKARYHLIGKILAYPGTIIMVIPISAIIIGMVHPYLVVNISPSSVPILIGSILFGFIMTCVGVSILRGVGKVRPLVTKGGEPIHLAEVWDKGTESGLYLTSCGKMVSIKQTSETTTHVGYNLVTSQGGTCRDCSVREGGRIMRSASRKEY